jgi:hypothetical protein
MAGGRGDRESGVVLRDLGDGLALRRAKPGDAEAVAAFDARVHHSPGGPFERREPHLLQALFPKRPSNLQPVCCHVTA